MYIIDDTTAVPREGGTGFVAPPPNYSSPAVEAFSMPLIPRDEWAERIKDKFASKSRLSDIRRSADNGKPIRSYNQGRIGYCWNHSATGCHVLIRAIMGQPYRRLSAFMVGCLIKNYQNQGGWGAQALEFIMQTGQCEERFWAEQSMDRSNDTRDMRANAAKYKITEAWQDLDKPVYNRNLTEDQAMTVLLSGIPLIGDFNWWGHSVAVLDATLIGLEAGGTPVYDGTDLGSLDFNNAKDVAVYSAAFGKKIWNSWSDDWGDLGEADLQGSKALLNGGTAPRVASAA